MWDEVFTKAPGIELIRPLETSDDEAPLIKAVFRIEDRKRWGKQVVQLLEASADDEPEFWVAINKAYYLDETSKKPTFAWSLLVWGDIAEAEEVLAPILLAEAKAQPAPPKTIARETVTPRHTSQIRKAVRESPSGGKITEFKLPLPHYKDKRNTRLTRSDTHKLGEVSRGAVVDNIGGEPIEPSSNMFREE